VSGDGYPSLPPHVMDVTAFRDPWAGLALAPLDRLIHAIAGLLWACLVLATHWRIRSRTICGSQLSTSFARSRQPAISGSVVAAAVHYAELLKALL